MNNSELYFSIVFLMIILGYFIRVIYEHIQGNIEITNKYLKYAIVIISTLTIGSYVFNIDHKQFIYNHQKEIYQLDSKLLNSKLNNSEFEKEKVLINKRINFLKDDIKLMSNMMGRINFMYYIGIIVSLIILLVMMHYEKKKLLNVNSKNKRK